jgi:hypothetical protein
MNPEDYLKYIVGVSTDIGSRTALKKEVIKKAK